MKPNIILRTFNRIFNAISTNSSLQHYTLLESALTQKRKNQNDKKTDETPYTYQSV